MRADLDLRPNPDRGTPQTTPAGPKHRTVVGDLREAAEMIAFRHSVFALPFALIALITASGDRWPEARIWLWVVVAMVAARTAAMSFNRLADHRIDAANPRTTGRSLPAGRLSRRFVWGLTLVAALVFVSAAAQLNSLCLMLAPPTLAVLLGYSYAKRFTTTAHVWLGVALGIAPIGAWIAVTGGVDWPPIILGAAVAFWVAGFDTIYSMQDEAFDREHGLRSIPARLGAANSLRLARLFHLLAVVGFSGFAIAAGGGWIRGAAVLAAVGLMVWQHRLVRPGDLRAVDAAFFTANGTLSVVMFALFALAKALG